MKNINLLKIERKVSYIQQKKAKNPLKINFGATELYIVEKKMKEIKIFQFLTQN